MSRRSKGARIIEIDGFPGDGGDQVLSSSVTLVLLSRYTCCRARSLPGLPSLARASEVSGLEATSSPSGAWAEC